MISFNKPYLTGRETAYIEQAVRKGKLSGNGDFTKRCQAFFEERYGIGKALLTTSCTDALEMAAILLRLQPGDEVIVPSYTFVSTAIAFIREGATVVFADSLPGHPNVDASKLEALITPRTRAIVPVHYAGMACDMDTIMDLAERHDLLVVEDAAQAVESFHVGKHGRRPLGSIGHLAAFSFHETKNIISGEGGLLAINDERFAGRAEIIWEKGTNRAEFFRGEVNKYGWVDTGSSFLPSEVTAAFLWAQLENLADIQARRVLLWERYYEGLHKGLAPGVSLPSVPPHATNNAHMFYLVCRDVEQRTRLISGLGERGVKAVFHYLSLHASDYYAGRHDGRPLPHADRFTECLVRLPLFYELTESQVDKIVADIHEILAE